jgi:Phage major capsid protein E
MAMIDPFKDGFSVTTLSQAISILPNKYGRIGQLGLFTFRPLTTTNVAMDIYKDELSLVGTSAWGAPSPKNKGGKFRTQSFAIPHMPLEDDFPAYAAQNARAFGSENQTDTVAGKVNQALQTMKNKIDQTLEYRRMGTLKGLVVDADGTSVIYDYFAEFGVTKKQVTFVFGTTTTEIRDKCMEVVRHIEDNLTGELMQRVHVLASPEWFDAFVKHPTVKPAFANYAEAAQRIGGDMRKGFSFGGLTIEEYRGVVASKDAAGVANVLKFIDSGKAIAFPVGTSETFSEFAAPADFNESVNTTALPYYARQAEKKFGRGYDLHVQANILPICVRPNVLVELLS